MDNDEFEFKPLTEGLGFHKKNSSQITPPTGFSTAPAALAQSALKAASPFINSPLPRQSTTAPATEIPKFEKKFGSTAAPTPTPAPKPQPTPTPIPKHQPISPTKEFYNRKLAETLTNKNASLDFRDTQWVESSGHMGAYFFDLIVILGLACMFALSLSLITEVDLLQVLNTISFDAGIQFGTFLLVAAVIEIYLTLSRSFFGCSLGEWAFDLQLGKQDEQTATLYPVKVFWRTTLTLITGLVTLPVISLLLGKDIASKVGGLKLYKQ